MGRVYFQPPELMSMIFGHALETVPWHPVRPQDDPEQQRSAGEAPGPFTTSPGPRGWGRVKTILNSLGE